MVVRRGPDAAKKLGEYLLDVLATSHSAQVLHIQMSELVSPRTVQKMLDSIGDLTRSSDRLPRMALFCMGNGDLFVFAATFTGELLRQLTIFMGTTIGGIDPDDISSRCHIYDVPDDAMPLRRLIKGFLQDLPTAAPAAAAPASAAPSSPAPAPAAPRAAAPVAAAPARTFPAAPAGAHAAAPAPSRSASAPAAARLAGPLDLPLLGRLKALIETIDLAPFVQQQPVCTKASGWQIAYIESFFDIERLRQVHFPEVDLAASEPLFLELTRELDDLMLVRLLGGLFKRRSPLGLNLAVRTVHSPAFEEVSRRLSASERQSIVCELHWSEALQDIQDGGGAIEALSGRGYRIALDRIGLRVLPCLDLAALPVHYVKVRFEREAIGAAGPAVVAAMRRYPPGRLVLTQCDDRRALALGEALSVTNYQGRLIDQIHARAA
jgi:hypothetical protein